MRKKTKKKHCSKNPILAVDGLIFNQGKVLLVRRAVFPFKNYWVLPGGHVNYGERVEEAIRREMKEELGILPKIKRLLGVYSDPKRDPRYHAVSIVYLLSRGRGQIRLNKEAFEFRYFSLKHLPRKIGFDHRKIIKDFSKQV
ncbi:NUDIX hydrolase [bacterium]|nr:NUDIX hydrolase [bacterium]